MYKALIFFKFPPKITSLIMNCITTSQIAVLVNGGQTNYFKPSKGIRQGDPLSPYLFILTMELLSVYIHYQVDISLWNPIKIGPKGPLVSHIFYADNLTFMAQANRKTINSIHHSLTIFCSLSGHKINNNKSKILFSGLLHYPKRLHNQPFQY